MANIELRSGEETTLTTNPSSDNGSVKEKSRGRPSIAEEVEFLMRSFRKSAFAVPGFRDLVCLAVVKDDPNRR